MDKVKEFYLNGTYFENNPSWDSGDAQWKFPKLQRAFLKIPINVGDKIIEIGCGGGELLKLFAKKYQNLQFEGWDIAPQAERFWKTDIKNIQFQVGDFILNERNSKSRAMLLIDVLEHVADPVNFLSSLRDKTDYILIHLPLDMTSINALLDGRLIEMRLKVGHIHYFTRRLGLQMIKDAGFEILESSFTHAWVDSPQLTPVGRVFRLLRSMISFFSPDLNARLLGGETLIVLCRPLPKLLRRGEV